jgi:colicin import membrane protein
VESGRLRPWIGSIVVHGAVVAALALAAVQWRTPPQPEQLAIEGNVVRYEDLPATVKAGKPLRESAPEAKTTPEPALAPPPEPRVQPELEPPTPPPPDPAVLQRQADEAAARAKAEAQAKAAQQLVAEQNAAQKRAADEQRKLEAKRKAEEQRELEEQRTQAALEARQKQAEQEKAAVAAKARAAKEADLRRQLEAEEAGEALARSGVVDEYRTLLIQTIERNWIRPASARAGLECTLNVTQATGGTVLDVKIGDCNGDQAVRESVANAVYRSSPLPAPRDARAFERRLVIVFKPTE